MSSLKRAANRQLTQDNWNDDDDEKESPGVYKSVDASVLQNRVIKKAKRSLPEAQEKHGQSPFSKFSGFGSKAGNSVPSLGFLTNIREKSVPQATNADSPENKQNGPNSLKSELPEKNKQTPKNSEESSHSTKDSTCVKKTFRDVQYYRHLKALNESVLQWLQMHTGKNPWCDLTPVFNDYRKHINTIEQKFPLKEKSSASPKAFKPFSFKVPSAPMQKMCNSADEEKPAKSSEPDSKMVKVSSGGDTESTEMLYGAGFKSSTTNTSTFSFGIKPTTTATVPSSNSGPTSSFSSSEKEKTENESSPFSFTKPTESSSTNVSGKSESRPFTFAVTPVANKEHENQQNSGKGMNDDEEYVPPKNEVVNIQEEGSVYSKRCKLFYKNDGTYKEKGVGTLYLKPMCGSIQLLIRGDTVVGKILLNIKLASSLPMQRMGKNNVLVSCVPNPPIGPDNSDAKEPVSFLIRTKTGDDADELFDMLNKYKS